VDLKLYGDMDDNILWMQAAKGKRRLPDVMPVRTAVVGGPWEADQEEQVYAVKGRRDYPDEGGYGSPSSHQPLLPLQIITRSANTDSRAENKMYNL